MLSPFFIVETIILIAGVFGLSGALLRLYKKNSLKNLEIIKEREESQRRLYELAILKEIGERAGYSLDIEVVLQIITGSLRQFIDYSVVAYMVVLPNKLKLHLNLGRSVGHDFLKELKERMVASLSALTDRKFNSLPIEDTTSGAIAVDEVQGSIGSFFNIPLVVEGNLAGVLTVANTEKGLYKEADMTILYKIVSQASEALSRLQEVVRVEKGKLNAMVESMGDGVLMVDNEYRVVVANPAIKKLISFKEEREITIFDFIDFLGGKFDIRGRLEEAIVKGQDHNSPRKEISGTFFEVGVYPVKHLRAGTEKVSGAVAVFHDITEEVQLERVREEFTSMIVHELRSPLDGTRKILESLVSGNVKKSSKDFAQYINMVYQSSTSMLELVNDILDFSKLQAGKFEVHLEEGSPREVVENRISFYKVSADTKNIKLGTYLDESLPALSRFDPHSIKQVLNNFISNALKFTPTGGRIEIVAFALEIGAKIPDSALEKFKLLPVKLTVEHLPIKEKSIVVAVSDSGIGIPKDDTKDLFLKYKQGSQSSIYSEERGTGLGLVIAKGIVEAHGGTIGVESIEGQGSTFFFTIPIS